MNPWNGKIQKLFQNTNSMVFEQLILEIYQESQFNPPRFFQISPKPPGIFREKKVILEASISDLLVVGSIICCGSTLPKETRKIQKALPIQDFHRFRYKNLLKFIFLELFLTIICYFHILLTDFTYNVFMILNWNSGKNLENFLKISVFIKIFSFQDRRLFTFNVITWLNVDLEQNCFHQNIPHGISP